MKCKTLFLLFIFFFISTSHIFAEPYKSGNFPSDEIINKNLEKMFQKLPGVKGGKYIGKRQQEKNMYKIFYSINGGSVGINFDELDYALSVRLEKLDNNIWVLNENMILQK